MSNTTLPLGGVWEPLEDQFRAFHASHPEVYRELVTLARTIKSAGHDHYGMKSLFEVLRWHRAMQGGRPEDYFKLNNNHTAYYSRLIESQEPDLAHFFRKRELRAA